MTEVRILSIIPPMTQLNTPYPATAYLTGFLRGRGYDVVQADPGLDWVLRLLSPASILSMAAALKPMRKKPPAVAHLVGNAEVIAAQIGPVLAFLQGKDPS